MLTADYYYDNENPEEVGETIQEIIEQMDSGDISSITPVHKLPIIYALKLKKGWHEFNELETAERVAKLIYDDFGKKIQ